MCNPVSEVIQKRREKNLLRLSQFLRLKDKGGERNRNRERERERDDVWCETILGQNVYDVSRHFEPESTSEGSSTSRQIGTSNKTIFSLEMKKKTFEMQKHFKWWQSFFSAAGLRRLKRQ